MADFAKLAKQLEAQRAAKAEAVEQAPPAAAKPTSSKPAAARSAAAPAPAPAAAERSIAKPGRPPAAESKRRGWLARTYYLRPETAARLKLYVAQQQVAGGAIADASEAVDAALTAWLDQAERSRG